MRISDDSVRQQDSWTTAGIRWGPILTMCQTTAEDAACTGDSTQATINAIFNRDCCGSAGCVGNFGIPTKCSAQV